MLAESQPNPFEYETLAERPPSVPAPPFVIFTVWTLGLDPPGAPMKLKLALDREMTGDEEEETAKLTEIVCGVLAATLDITETVAV